MKWSWRNGKDRTHAEIRAEQRYGITLTWADTIALRDKIVAKKGQFIEKDGPVETWLVHHGPTPLFVLFDRSRRKLVTVIPDQRAKLITIQLKPSLLQRLDIWLRSWK